VRSIKILVVDDFESFRRFVCSVLQQRAEFQVIGQAADGLEALQKAEQLLPDLILLDIGLPKLNGLETAKRLPIFAPHAKIVFISQETSPDVVQETFRLGAQGYVHKLRATRDLLPAIEAVLRGKRFVSSGLEISEASHVPRRHEVQLYSADSVFLESSTDFIASALKAGNPAIVIATKSHREGLVLRLREEGLNVNDAIQQGTYISLDAHDMLSTINVDAPDPVGFFEGLCGLLESAAKAAKKEHPGIALCGECCPLLCAEGHTNAAIQLETVGNRLIQTHRVDMLCPYALSSFPERENDHAFKNICAEHTAVYSG